MLLLKGLVVRSKKGQFMKNITIERLLHNSSYYRVSQGTIRYEPLTIDEVKNLIEELMTNFNIKEQFYEVFFDDYAEPRIRREVGWCIEAESFQEIIEKYQSQYRILSIRWLEPSMPFKKYKITYDFVGYSSNKVEKVEEYERGRVPCEALYWFKEHFGTPTGVYEIRNVEEVNDD